MLCKHTHSVPHLFIWWLPDIWCGSTHACRHSLGLMKWGCFDRLIIYLSVVLGSAHQQWTCPGACWKLFYSFWFVLIHFGRKDTIFNTLLSGKRTLLLDLGLSWAVTLQWREGQTCWECWVITTLITRILYFSKSTNIIFLKYSFTCKSIHYAQYLFQK